MKQYPASKIRNIALLGHGGSGKTTLADAMLYSAGAIDRIGKSGDGTTTLDFDPEEKKRKSSVSTAVYPIEYGGCKLNIIDAPGLFDFAGGICEALTAADSVILALSGKSGLAVGAELSFGKARKLNKPCAFFIGKLDSPNANFYKVLSTLTGKYGALICPVVVPYIEGEKLVCYVNLIDGKAYTYNGTNASEYSPAPTGGNIENMRNIMLEAIASADENLMEKYFAGEAFTTEEIITGLSEGALSGEICPVFAGAGQTGEGVPLLLDILAQIMPAADSVSYSCVIDGKDTTIKCDPNGVSAAVVFKTIADPFVGKLSYFKVISGKVSSESHIVNSRTGIEARIAKVMLIKGGKQEDSDYIGTGDIGSVAKLSDVLTGDTLCEAGKINIKPVPFPAPTLSMAVWSKIKGEEEKISAGLGRLMEEDPSIKYELNTETHEQVLSGLGEQHLDVIASKLKVKFGVDVVLSSPKVAYRETIRKKVKVQGRHKKQSGGHGQFGDVWIEFEPCDNDMEDLVFEDKVFGGAVPKNFFPAVEKGLQDCILKGVLAGYPMVGLKATLVDGSYHPVDSSEMSFKMAAALAYKNGIPQASPVLLEPIGTLKVQLPDDNMGDVIGDINKRRGRVLGMNPSEDQMQEIVAEVPIAEMSDFSTAMRSLTQGRATFSLNFERYEETPPMIAQRVIDDTKAGE